MTLSEAESMGVAEAKYLFGSFWLHLFAGKKVDK